MFVEPSFPLLLELGLEILVAHLLPFWLFFFIMILTRMGIGGELNLFVGLINDGARIGVALLLEAELDALVVRVWNWVHTKF